MADGEISIDQMVNLANQVADKLGVPALKNMVQSFDPGGASALKDNPVAQEVSSGVGDLYASLRETLEADRGKSATIDNSYAQSSAVRDLMYSSVNNPSKGKGGLGVC